MPVASQRGRQGGHSPAKKPFLDKTPDAPAITTRGSNGASCRSTSIVCCAAVSVPGTPLYVSCMISHSRGSISQYFSRSISQQYHLAVSSALNHEAVTWIYSRTAQRHHPRFPNSPPVSQTSCHMTPRPVPVPVRLVGENPTCSVPA